MNLLIALIIILFLFGGMGYVGHTANWNAGYWGGGSLINLLIALLILRLLGIF